jgi:hypothetical protein
MQQLKRTMDTCMVTQCGAGSRGAKEMMKDEEKRNSHVDPRFLHHMCGMSR